SRLIRGMKIDDVIDRFASMPICPSSKVTSCPEQLRKALLEVRSMLDNGTEPRKQPLGLDSFSALFK
ncbi:MAG: TSCPD domain-containing protein, partial [Mailhella sp.]|nr:TSCPD domain-containing protein [Mailhella sp.]